MALADAVAAEAGGAPGASCSSSPGGLSLAEAARRSSWPLEALEDPRKRPVLVDDPAAFLSFVCYGDHSRAQLCVLRDGVRRLGLEEAIPPALLEACRKHRCPVEGALAAVEAEAGGLRDGLDGDVFFWAAGERERGEVKRGSLRSRLERCRAELAGGAAAYVAELSRERKTRHELTGERCRPLTRKDVKDCAGGHLPMWDRGHCFVGAEGVGSCMHVDQAWWSNVGKNFLGHKLVAVWGPAEAAAALRSCGGQLFRRPLSPEQRACVLSAARVALLGPGDVASFTGGLPHATMVVGDELNLTGYESLVNWHPRNAALLLRGAERCDRQAEVMPRSRLRGLFDDIVESVRDRARSGDFPAGAGAPACGAKPEELLAGFRAVLLRRRYCARQLLADSADADAASGPDSLASSSSCGGDDDGEVEEAKEPPGKRQCLFTRRSPSRQ